MVGAQYPMGPTGRMDSGYFPKVLAAVLVGFGVVAVMRSLVLDTASHDEVGIGLVEATREPVLHQLVEQHEALWIEDEPGRIAVMEADGLAILECDAFGSSHVAAISLFRAQLEALDFACGGLRQLGSGLDPAGVFPGAGCRLHVGLQLLVERFVITESGLEDDECLGLD